MVKAQVYEKIWNIEFLAFEKMIDFLQGIELQPFTGS